MHQNNLFKRQPPFINGLKHPFLGFCSLKYSLLSKQYSLLCCKSSMTPFLPPRRLQRWAGLGITVLSFQFWMTFKLCRDKQVTRRTSDTDSHSFRAGAGKLPPTGQTWPVFINSFIGMQPCPGLYSPSLAVFLLQGQNWGVETQTMRPESPN